MSYPWNGYGPLQVSEITHGEAFIGLREEWTELWQRCPDATPFQAPEWLLPWWIHFGHGDLSVLTLRRSGRLVGLVPLLFQRLDGRRVVSPLGAGMAHYSTCLFAPEAGREGPEALFEHLASMRGRWEVADLQELPPDSPLLESAPPDGFRARLERQSLYPTLALPGSPEAFEAGLPRHQRRNLQRGRQRLAALGDLRLEAADADSLDEALEACFHLHAARWQQPAAPGGAPGPEVQDFHRAAAPGLLARGRLRLYTLRLDGRIVATLCALVGRQRMCAYRGGFDPAQRRTSPGSVLMQHAIADAIALGCRAFDFLRGTEMQMSAWGATDRPTFRLLLYLGGTARPAAQWPTPETKITPEVNEELGAARR